MKSVGIIRGDGLDPNNPTLRFCLNNGMTLHFISREEYKNKSNSLVVQNIIGQYASSYVIPEGGSNELALTGVQEIWEEIYKQLEKIPDYIFLPLEPVSYTHLWHPGRPEHTAFRRRQNRYRRSGA